MLWLGLKNVIETPSNVLIALDQDKAGWAAFNFGFLFEDYNMKSFQHIGLKNNRLSAPPTPYASTPVP